MRKIGKIEEIWDEDRQRLYERKPPPREITRLEKLKKLWVDYLRISPSYEAARKVIKNGASPQSFEKLFGDFQLVQQTFNDFGDVWRVRPSAVYQWTEKSLFKATLLDPKVRQIAAIPAMESGNREQIDNTLSEYLEKIRPNSGMHGSLILAIPPQLSKRDLLVQISNLLNNFNYQYKQDKSDGKPKAKYECQVSKLREAAIRQSFEAVILRSQHPSWPIWKIGVDLNLHPGAAQEIKKSESMQNTIAPGRKRLNKDDNAAGAKILMNSLVSRCFKRAFLIAENAAKGKFPCTDPILDGNGKKLDAHFDYNAINNKLAAYQKKYPDLEYPYNSFETSY
jgi:hypothetical protein